MKEEVVQIAFSNDMGDKHLVALSSKGRIFICSNKDGLEMKWREIPAPKFEEAT